MSSSKYSSTESQSSRSSRASTRTSNRTHTHTRRDVSATDSNFTEAHGLIDKLLREQKRGMLNVDGDETPTRSRRISAATTIFIDYQETGNITTRRRKLFADMDEDFSDGEWVNKDIKWEDENGMSVLNSLPSVPPRKVWRERVGDKARAGEAIDDVEKLAPRVEGLRIRVQDGGSEISGRKQKKDDYRRMVEEELDAGSETARRERSHTEAGSRYADKGKEKKDKHRRRAEKEAAGRSRSRAETGSQYSHAATEKKEKHRRMAEEERPRRCDSMIDTASQSSSRYAPGSASRDGRSHRQKHDLQNAHEQTGRQSKQETRSHRAESDTRQRKLTPEAAHYRKARAPAIDVDKPLLALPIKDQFWPIKGRIQKPTEYAVFVDHFAKKPNPPPRSHLLPSALTNPPPQPPASNHQNDTAAFSCRVRRNSRSGTEVAGRWHASNAKYDYDGQMMHIHRRARPWDRANPESSPKLSTASSTQESAISEYWALPKENYARNGNQIDDIEADNVAKMSKEWRRRVRIVEFVKALLAHLKEKDLLKKLENPRRQPVASNETREEHDRRHGKYAPASGNKPRNEQRERGHGNYPSDETPRPRAEECGRGKYPSSDKPRAHREQNRSAPAPPTTLLPDFSEHAADKHAKLERFQEAAKEGNFMASCVREYEDYMFPAHLRY